MKKFNLLILLISILWFSSKSNAQDAKKIVVAIPGFRASNNTINSETITSIHQRVIDAFVSNSKFSVVERNQLEELQNELNLQRTESFIDGTGNISDKVKNSGAQILVTGVISRVEYSKQKKEKTEYDAVQKKSVVTGYYDVFFCTIEMNIKLIDLTTSQIVLSEVINAKNSSEESGLFGSFLNSSTGSTTSAAAYEGTLRDISSKVTLLIRRAFPNVLSIAEITEKDKNGMAKELLLAGDFTDGMGKKQDLYVKLITETVVNGKKMVRKKVIGKVRVLKVEEGGFISAKIRDGEEEITKSFEEKLLIQITETE
jgi:curli biogenesis system outer membrane secretion channel CsgG